MTLHCYSEPCKDFFPLLLQMSQSLALRPWLTRLFSFPVLLAKLTPYSSVPCCGQAPLCLVVVIQLLSAPEVFPQIHLADSLDLLSIFLNLAFSRRPTPCKSPNFPLSHGPTPWTPLFWSKALFLFSWHPRHLIDDLIYLIMWLWFVICLPLLKRKLHKVQEPCLFLFGDISQLITTVYGTKYALWIEMNMKFGQLVTQYT